MECIQCGATLRPGARFCNNCGARQPQPEDASAGVTSAGAEIAQSAQGAPAGGTAVMAEADDGARVKRPPRVPRASDDDEEAERPPAADNGLMTNLLPEEQANDEGDAVAQADASGSAPAQAADAADIPEASVADFYAMLPGGERDEAEMPALTELSREHLTAPAPSAPETPTDGMPWPLPVHMIVGGRYRVEWVTATASDMPGAENRYMVSDLQGYERCWSCGKEYGQTAAADQFCRECGADMLAREYVMTERRLPPGAAQEQPAAQAPEAAEDQAEVADQAHKGEQHEGEQIEAPEQQAAPAETPAETEVASTAGEPATEDQAQETAVREFRQGTRAYRVEPYVPEPVLFPHGVRIVAAAASDAGQVRAADGNEDSVGLFVFNEEHGSVALPLALGVVADGLGGHVSGQDASRLAVRALTDHVLRSAALPLVGMPVPTTPPEDVLREVLLEGAQAANAAVYTANQSSGGDMGSTIVAALICGGMAYIANAGDSRGYVLDGGELRRITTDHSLVEQLIAGGLIAPEERYTHPKRNQIFRSLGDEPTAAVDIFTQKLRPGMRLLLCSDGLWEMVRDDELAAILRETPNPREACDILVQRANEHGGEDNISALVIEVSD